MQNYTQLHSTTSFSPTTLVVEILIKSFAPVCIQWTHPAIERKTSISHAWDDTFTCPANLFFYCELSTCNLFSLSSENCICKSKYRVSRRGTYWAWSLGQKLHLGRIQSAYIKCVKIIKRVFVLETLLAFLSIHYAVHWLPSHRQSVPTWEMVLISPEMRLMDPPSGNRHIQMTSWSLFFNQVAQTDRQSIKRNSGNSSCNRIA